MGDTIPGNSEHPGITKCMAQGHYFQKVQQATHLMCHSLCIDSFQAAGGLSDDGHNCRCVTNKNSTVEKGCRQPPGGQGSVQPSQLWPELHLRFSQIPLPSKVVSIPLLLSLALFSRDEKSCALDPGRKVMATPMNNK